MVTIKEMATNYIPKSVKNITDSKVIPLDVAVFEEKAKDVFNEIKYTMVKRK